MAEFVSGDTDILVATTVIEVGVDVPNATVMVVENALSFAKDNGFTPIHLTFSPVKGPEGNIEYLMHLKKGEYESALPIPAEIVRLSHQTLSE